MAVVHYYLTIDGFNGGATGTGVPAGAFEISSLQLGGGVGVSGGVASLPSFSELTVSMVGTSPTLLGLLASGTELGSVRVQGLDELGALIYDLRLGEVFLTADSLSSGGDTPSSSLSFNYERIGLTTAAGSFGYDIINDAAIDPTAIAAPVAAGVDVLETGATIQYYLVIDGYNGGSTGIGAPAGAFDIASLQVGAGVDVSGGVASDPSFSEVVVTMGGVSPSLFTQLASSTSVSSARIVGVNGAGTAVYDLRLGDVLLTGDSLSAGGSAPSSSLSLNYQSIGLVTPTSSFGYDTATNAAINPATIATPTPAGGDILETGQVVQYYLTINGLNGGSATQKGAFEIDSLQLGAGVGVSAGVASDPSFSELVVTMTGISPALFGGITSGKGISSIRVQGVDGKGTVIYDLRLGDVLVSGDSFSSGGDAPSSSLSFNYRTIGLVTPTSSFGYDVANQVAINPGTIATPSISGTDSLETAAPAHYYLVLNGFNGGAVGKGAPVGAFDITSMQLGAGRGVSSGTPRTVTQPSFSELTVTMDGVSPALIGGLASGTGISSARVIGVDGNGATIYDLRLGDVLVTGDSFSAGSDTPSSSLSFNYQTFGLLTPTSSFGFNTASNTVIDPTTIATPTGAGTDSLENGAVVQYYLTISGLNGGSLAQKGAFDISSLNFGAGVNVTNGVATDPAFSELTVTMNGFSPALLGELTSVAGTSTVRVQGVNDKGAVIYDLRLGDVLVTGDSFSTGGGPPSSSLSLNYQRFGLLTPTSSFGYDLVNHVAINPATIAAPAVGVTDSLETASAAHYYLIVDGYDGGVVGAGVPEHAFEITSLQFGAGRGVSNGDPRLTSLPLFSEVTVTMSDVSPALLAELATGAGVGSARVQGVDDKGAVIYDLRLGDVILTGSSFSAGAETPSSSLSFSYERIGVTTPTSTFGYDTASNVVIDPTSIVGGVTVNGTSGADLITTAHTVAGQLLPGAGNDTLNGLNGDDTLSGGAGDDILIGGAGDDVLIDAAGSLGVANLNGGAGNDAIILTGAFLSGTVNGSVGTDQVTASGDVSGLTFKSVEILNAGASVLTGTAAQFRSFQTIRRSEADTTGGVTLVLSTGGILNLTNKLAGRAANITGSAGLDVITGSTGNDVFDGAGSGDTLNGADGDDMLIGGEGPDTLNGGNGDDIIDAGIGNDVITGGAGADVITDIGGLVVNISGGVGNDVITIGPTLQSGTVNGGLDVDQVNASGNLQAISFVGVEILNAGSGLLTATAAQMEAFDTIRVSGADPTGAVNLRLSAAGTINLAGELAGRSATFTGSSGNDGITTSDGNDTINGGAGNDVIIAGLGNDLIIQQSDQGRDIIDGHSGTDTYRLNGTAAAETFRIMTRAEAVLAGITGLAAATEIVITRDGTNTASVIAELDNVEEISINTLLTTANNGNGTVDGGTPAGDTIIVIGDFTTTSLAYSTIHIAGSAANDTVDISGLTSAHRVVFDANGGADAIIGEVRPQDVVTGIPGISASSFSASNPYVGGIESALNLMQLMADNNPDTSINASDLFDDHSLMRSGQELIPRDVVGHTSLLPGAHNLLVVLDTARPGEHQIAADYALM